MKTQTSFRRPQQGMMLIEALIAILIFSLGILGMVAMGSVAVAAQSDAQYRTEAANYASEMASSIATLASQGAYSSVTHTFATPPVLATLSHLPVDGGYCVFAGDKSTNPLVTDWVNRISGAGPNPKVGLPGSTDTSQSIMVAPTVGGYNQVTITICWKPPSANVAYTFAPQHRYVLVTYIN